VFCFLSPTQQHPKLMATLIQLRELLAHGPPAADQGEPSPLLQHAERTFASIVLSDFDAETEAAAAAAAAVVTAPSATDGGSEVDPDLVAEHERDADELFAPPSPRDFAWSSAGGHHHHQQQQQQLLQQLQRQQLQQLQQQQNEPASPRGGMLDDLNSPLLSPMLRFLPPSPRTAVPMDAEGTPASFGQLTGSIFGDALAPPALLSPRSDGPPDVQPSVLASLRAQLSETKAALNVGCALYPSFFQLLWSQCSWGACFFCRGASAPLSLCEHS
jgi:hypothetical protein